MKKIDIANHVIYRGADLVALYHLSQNEIHERQHYNCNIASDGEPPFCGNCMFEAYDPETNISYCMASKRLKAAKAGAECGKPIAAAGGMNPEQVAQYTAKKYNKPLCGECATKAASAAKDGAE